MRGIRLGPDLLWFWSNDLSATTLQMKINIINFYVHNLGHESSWPLLPKTRTFLWRQLSKQVILAMNNQQIVLLNTFNLCSTELTQRSQVFSTKFIKAPFKWKFPHPSSFTTVLDKFILRKDCGLASIYSNWGLWIFQAKRHTEPILCIPASKTAKISSLSKEEIGEIEMKKLHVICTDDLISLSLPSKTSAHWSRRLKKRQKPFLSCPKNC